VPLFVFIGHDGPRSVELRPIHRPAHLAGLEPLDHDGRVRFAGPMVGEAGAPIGSVIVFEAADLDEARAIAARDAYVTEGIFDRYEVHETKQVFPKDA
jgi:uncharacterized protein YciI